MSLGLGGGDHPQEGGHVIALDIALLYAAVTFLLSLLVALYETKISRQKNSELLRVDATEWIVDALLSLALLIGFIMAYVLEYVQLFETRIDHLIDPLLTFSWRFALVACPCLF